MTVVASRTRRSGDPRDLRPDRTSGRGASCATRLLSVPFIYAMAVPLLLLDAGFSAYQRVCFPLYRIARVRRRDYFVFDRARLPYLDVVDKFNCLYCSYANGLLAYATEIAARTEQYWCPIRHERAPRAVHARYPRFMPYGDGRDHARRVDELRRSLIDD